MRYQTNISVNTKKFIFLLSLLALALPTFAQESLFSTARAQTNSTSRLAPGVQFEQAVTLHDVDTSFFTASLSGQQYIAVANKERNRSRRSNTGARTSSTSGVLLNSEGSKSGYFFVSESARQGQTARHIAFITETGEHFAITTNSGGESVLRKYDQEEMSDCGHDEHALDDSHLDSPQLRSISPRSTTQSSVQLDVLVMYTPEAATYAGGTLAMEALIGQAISLANTSYVNSEVALQLNLVHSAQTADNEGEDFPTDLNRLQAAEDGFFDEVHALRNEHSADMVVLMRSPGEYCGIGYSPTTVAGLTGGNFAFSAVGSNCVLNYSFQHEVGHNLGLQHDQSNAPSTTAYEASYGFRWTGTNSVQYRSVMAYSPGIRVPFFSNPEIAYEGTSTGDSTLANNAATLRVVSAMAANYRTNPNGSTNGSGETPTSENGSVNEGEIPVAFDVTTTTSKNSITFTIQVRAESGAGVSDQEVTVQLKGMKRSVKDFDTLTTNVDGVAELTVPRKKKGSTLLFSVGDLATVSQKVPKKKGRSRISRDGR
ncbi:MAG: hypothetical protein KDD70_00120 [Bdellovibrionales bacterium]|nr:hypothetical protein [Bdellovibrionales bacterium]